MNMTSTLDFRPDRRCLEHFVASTRLPVYRPHGFHDPTPEAPSIADGNRGVDDGPSRGSLRINWLLAAACGALLIVAYVGFGSGAAANSPSVPASPSSSVDASIEVYVVQPGDTLWSIAERITPTGRDLRPTVDYLDDAAGGSRLDVGQRIIIDHSVVPGA